MQGRLRAAKTSAMALAGTLLLCASVAPSAQAGWLPPVSLSAAGENTGAPHVVLDAQGNATAVWGAWNGEHGVIESAYRPAGEGWQAPVVISDVGEETVLLAGERSADYPTIAVDANGAVTVVWERGTGSDETVIQSTSRDPGGAWGTPVDISYPAPTASTEEPRVGVDADGEATAVWKHSGVLQSADRPAGGSWQMPVDISEAGHEALTPQAAVDAAGDATAVWMIQEGGLLVARTSYRPAGSGWRTPEALSAQGEEGGDPQIALDAHGDALAVWTKDVGYDNIVRGSYRPASGAWQGPADISAEGEDAQSPQVALDGSRDALVAWAGDTNIAGGYVQAKATYRPAAGGWEAAAVLSEDGGNAFPTDLAFDQQGNAVVVWERSTETDNIVQSDYRPAGEGAWQAPASLSAEGRKSFDPVVVLDAEGEVKAAQGDATVVWTSGEGEYCREIQSECPDPVRYTVQAAGYDTDPPSAESLQAPATGTVGKPVEFSASSVDSWSPRLEFGDGTSADSTSALHTYTAPGEYTVQYASTEVLGYRTSTRRAIKILPAQSGGGGSSSASTTPSLTTITNPPAATGAPLPKGTPPAPTGSHGPLAPPRLGLARQTLRAILAQGSVAVVCRLDTPGTCTVRGPAGDAHTTSSAARWRPVAVRLTRKMLARLGHGHSLELPLLVTVRVNDGSTRTIRLSLAVR
jgi:PKD domain